MATSIPQMNRTYTFTSREGLQLNFRKLNVNELMRQAQSLPKVEKGREPTPEDDMKAAFAMCEALASASRDGYTAEQFRELDVTTICEAWKFLFNLSANEAQLKSMLSQHSTTLVT